MTETMHSTGRPSNSEQPSVSASESAAQTSFLDNIREAYQQLSPPFWCAGDVSVAKGTSDSNVAVNSLTVCCPYQVDNSQVLQASLISFPVKDMGQLEQLKSLCAPAVFGKGDQDVLDPSYRKALALSTDRFYTNFDLSNHGILDTIKAVMMPHLQGHITADLYKLNIYRLGDFFKADVDTPRGDDMFGSLVVCLPQPHTGGALLVKHKGREQHLELAPAAEGALRWAAFYSDCEHEILPVESGHRITLTYNLYAAKVEPGQGPLLPGMCAASSTMYQQLAAALASPFFMPNGGRLGFACQHAYPHSHGPLLKAVSSMLKGEDAACYKVLQQLGLGVKIQSVRDYSEDGWEIEEWRKGEGEEGVDEDQLDENEDANYENEGGKRGYKIPYQVVDDLWNLGDDNYCYDHGYDSYGRDEVLQSLSEATRDASNILWVAHNLEYNAAQSSWGYYGNEGARAYLTYSAAALLAAVPAWSDEGRKQMVQKLQL